jgi:hypothetical protein
MNKSEREAFLAEPRVAVLSIPQEGLGPLSSPVWFDYEPGGVIWFLIQSNSRKGELLTLGQRVSLCMQRETRPYAYVSVEGPVVALEPYSLDDDLAPMANRYLGEEAGAAYADGMRERHALGNSLKVTVEPENWRTVDYAK